MSTQEPRIDLGIVVRDIDACLPFYRDVLGLPVVREIKREAGGMWQLACGPCVLRLVVPDPLPDAANPRGAVFGATGLRYWTIEVADIEAMITRCEASGVAVSMPITATLPGVRIAMVEDPEGNTLEFIQRDAG